MKSAQQKVIFEDGKYLYKSYKLYQSQNKIAASLIKKSAGIINNVNLI